MRTKIIALLLASAGMAVTVSACKGAVENQAEQAQGSASGIDLAAMDKSVKPGDDFFLYANGSWFKSSEIPADKSRIGSHTIANDQTEKNLEALIADLEKSEPEAGIGRCPGQSLL